MPRRKPKHAFKAGEPSANPYGRPPGSINEINRRIKEAFTLILENKLPELEEWLTRAAQRDPLKTADLLLRISERFTPSLSRTEITGAEGQAFTPITINIPNLTIGEGAPTSIPLQSVPNQMIGEGAPTINLPGGFEYSNSAVSERDGHYGHLDSAVSGEIPEESPVEAPSQEIPDTEEVLENSPVFAPEIDTPLREEDAFDPIAAQQAFQEWQSKKKPL
jgi:hypothetical protein